jgi:hypothetical protein
MLDTPNPPNLFVYSEHRQTFGCAASVLRISSTRLDDRPVERRELHITAIPLEKKLKERLESVVFRIVENTNENPKDKAGHSIVGGFNTFPEPIHVVLFVTPEAMSLLNQRACGSGFGKSSISICPGVSLLEWDQSDAIPIYECEFHFG